MNGEAASQWPRNKNGSLRDTEIGLLLIMRLFKIPQPPGKAANYFWRNQFILILTKLHFIKAISLIEIPSEAIPVEIQLIEGKGTELASVATGRRFQWFGLFLLSDYKVSTSTYQNLAKPNFIKLCKLKTKRKWKPPVPGVFSDGSHNCHPMSDKHHLLFLIENIFPITL